MAKRMLIDAMHPEEIRVVVHNENKLEDFDFETLSKKQLKGNIYLARVTRVEPSLQAAFVEYGGNRHGFLPFSEIHPDYYRIPVADREALLAEESAQEDEAVDNGTDTKGEKNASAESGDASGENAQEAESASEGSDDTIEELAGETSVDSLNEDDADIESEKGPRINLMRKYKIQEVIKRRQVLLVQVSKEERGNKGAALTTYLSLAGRYSVLMPNTNKGGGISRKISNPNDRKRLKEILNGLKIPEGIAVIVRTAGSQRSKAEIRRDYEYLMRLWNDIRETTLKSEAPCLIYEEANLIKRAIRDLYTSDMEDILVEGEPGYKMAKSFMRSLMPSHAKKVKHYKGMQIPLFHRYQVEKQIDAMHNPVVQLKSGGYIVINPTEALVAIDVNSGRATKERHIEGTAFKTNLEAAEEVARQLRLRDLAGLIVVDFIDMDEPKHNREVERRLKEAMSADRARIQLGRISPFGLLEMSRQRLRPSITENSTTACPHCDGIGTIRTTESTALHVLRALEEDGIRRGSGSLELFVPTDVALYILNQKRARLIEIEERYGFTVQVNADDQIVIPDFRLERLQANNDGPVDEVLPLEPSKPAQRDTAPRDEQEREEGDRKGKRRRRRRRKDRGDGAAEAEEALQTSDEEAGEDLEAVGEEGDGEDKPRKRRRRGKRGGRRRSRRREEQGSDEGVKAEGEAAEDAAKPESDGEPAVAAETAETAATADEAQGVESGAEGAKAEAQGEAAEKADAEEEKPKRRRAPRKRKPKEAVAESTEATAEAAASASAESSDGKEAAGKPVEAAAAEGEEKPAKPRRAPRQRKRPAKAKETAEASEAQAEGQAGDDKPKEAPKRRRRPAKAKDEAPASKPAAAAASSEEPTLQEKTPARAAAEPQAPSAEASANEAPATKQEPAKSGDGEATPQPQTQSPEPAAASQPAAPQPEPQRPEGPKKKGWWSRITGQ